MFTLIAIALASAMAFGCHYDNHVSRGPAYGGYGNNCGPAPRYGYGHGGYYSDGGYCR